MLLYRKYIATRFKNLRKYLDRFQYTQNAEDLYQFRVEFKKLKTFYSIYRCCIPSFRKNKDFKKLKKLYTESGSLRDEDVIQELLLKYKMNPVEENPEEREEKRRKRIKKFFKKTSCLISSFSSLEKKLKKTAEEIDIECLKIYIDEKRSHIRQKMAHPDTEVQLHEIRKEIKQLKYIAEVETGNIPVQTQRQYDSIQNQIGNWHDQLVLIEYLEKYYPSNRRPINKLLQESSRAAEVIKIRLLGI
ncbi:MAG: CHAD domain-containing protein [Chitinophagales bacterium]